MKRSDKKKQYRENVARNLGFQEGWQLANQLMEKAIKETPGIGPKRFEAIMKKRYGDEK